MIFRGIYMKIPYVFKKCTKCGRWLVASKANFYMSKTGKYGLLAQCKECMKKHNKQYRETNKDKVLEKLKRYRENNKEKIAEYQKQYYEDNRDKIAESRKQYYEDNKDKLIEYQKQYCEGNKDKVLERHKQYYEDNKEQFKQYYQDNKKKIAERCKQYRQSPQGQVARFNSNQKRRIKEQQQGDGVTKEQWLECMSFFDFKCAYSGERLTRDNRTIDHIVPLNSNGDNMVWNMVPMTRSLNSSKNDKDMLEWYKSQECFNRERLDKIYQWQEYAFNKWYKEEK